MRSAWEDNRRWVAAVLLAHKPKWADLEDLLQDVAASMVAHSNEVRDPSTFRAWLRTVAVNAARLAARKGALRQHAGLDQSPEPTTVPKEAEVLGREDETLRVAELALELPDTYREPLLLKAVQGLSYRQISQILGLPETTIETRIARGRRMLRELAEGGSVEQTSVKSGKPTESQDGRI